MISSDKRLKLFLFAKNISFVQQAEEAGIDSIIIDWEKHHKATRQKDHYLEINSDTPEDVATVASAVNIPVTVRINPMGKHTEEEVAIALDHGAKIIMLPMSHNPYEVERFLKIVNGRAQTIVQIETQSLVAQCSSLANLDWNYIYIGLNDLMISRQSKSIWESVADGTVEHIFETLKNRAIGFGGVTIIGGGKPIPFIELLQEMARLGCSLSFLRRTFKKEIKGRNLSAEIAAIRATWIAACDRSPEAIENDQTIFYQRLRELIK